MGPQHKTLIIKQVEPRVNIKQPWWTTTNKKKSETIMTLQKEKKNIPYTILDFFIAIPLKMLFMFFGNL